MQYGQKVGIMAEQEADKQKYEYTGNPCTIINGRAPPRPLPSIQEYLERVGKEELPKLDKESLINELLLGRALRMKHLMATYTVLRNKEKQSKDTEKSFELDPMVVVAIMEQLMEEDKVLIKFLNNSHKT